jgi:hypothetical protein
MLTDYVKPPNKDHKVGKIPSSSMKIIVARSIDAYIMRQMCISFAHISKRQGIKAATEVLKEVNFRTNTILDTCRYQKSTHSNMYYLKSLSMPYCGSINYICFRLLSQLIQACIT